MSTSKKMLLELSNKVCIIQNINNNWNNIKITLVNKLNGITTIIIINKELKNCWNCTTTPPRRVLLICEA